MMKDAVSPEIVRIGAANYTNQGEVLAVGAGNSVEDAEAADGEGDDACPDAAGPSVTVSGVPGVELVAAADVVEPRLGNEMVEKGKVKIAGDGEDIADADLDEPASDVAAKGGLSGSEDGAGRDGVEDGGDGAVPGEATNVVNLGGFTAI